MQKPFQLSIGFEYLAHEADHWNPVNPDSGNRFYDVCETTFIDGSCLHTVVGERNNQAVLERKRKYQEAEIFIQQLAQSYQNRTNQG